MNKIINGVKYYIPSKLTVEQEKIYCHIIDWKRKHITEERGLSRGHEYDAILPIYLLTLKCVTTITLNTSIGIYSNIELASLTGAY